MEMDRFDESNSRDGQKYAVKNRERDGYPTHN